MSRYYFDIHDGQHLTRDEIGTECSNPDEIRSEALMVLPSIARDILVKEGDRQAVTMIVRNASNLTVFTATLTFSSIWLGENTPPLVEDADKVFV